MKWLFEKFPLLETGEWISLGESIDRGANAENMLASIAGTTLRKEACDFSTTRKKSAESIYKDLLVVQKKMVKQLNSYLKNEPTPPLGRLVKRLKNG